MIHGDRVEPPEWLNERGRAVYLEWARKAINAGRWDDETVRFQTEIAAAAAHTLATLGAQGKPIRGATIREAQVAQKWLAKMIGAGSRDEEPAGDAPAGENPFASNGFSARHRKV